ncbi:hypothetical protein [Chishuiella sp.]|uniref:hypothetical protein n=1 Tax=Chishuiella sp. TaxID=1969467 RepID=UPI0028AA6E42|nr:hypothetical protein [Chishuiella sp.]
MNYQLNDTVIYNGIEFIISAFINSKGEMSILMEKETEKEYDFYDWVLLYNKRTSTQIKAHLGTVFNKEITQSDSTKTTDDKLSRLNF